MFYYPLKFLLNIFYRVYYRIGYKNMANVPSGQPIIISPNHNNAFIDPTVFAMRLPQEVYFFARSDVFNTPLKSWFMNKLHISPMYRIQEGYSEVKKNDKTFEKCKQLLSNNHSVILYPEGICIMERRVRRLKKGLARIAFSTGEAFDFKKDLWVVPVGMNYSNAKKFGSSLFMVCGEPIPIKQFEAQYRQDKVRTINEFSRVLEEKMKELMVIIDNPANDELVGGIEEICLADWMKERGFPRRDLEKETELRKEIAGMVNQLDTTNPDRASTLRELVAAYMGRLQKLGLRDHLLKPHVIEAMSPLSFINEFLILWFGTPVHLIGMAMNYPPFWLAKRFAEKSVKNVEFYASVYILLAMLLWLPWFGIQLLAVALIFRSWTLLGIYALTVMITFKFCLEFRKVRKKILGRWRLMKLVKKDKKAVEDLVYTRAAIVDEIRNLRQGSKKS